MRRSTVHRLDLLLPLCYAARDTASRTAFLCTAKVGQSHVFSTPIGRAMRASAKPF